MSQRYLRQAESDLQVAYRNVEPGSFYIAASLAHQSAEKALKAAHWYVRGEEAPWRHDLSACAERVADLVGGIPDDVDFAMKQLEPLFERTRYPSGNADEPIPVELVDEGTARAAIANAEEVIRWVRILCERPR